ncbi:MAG: hypothetical protein R2867_23405 [Caldilineaceae bacterium]
MQEPTLSRRELLATGGATVATLALLNHRFAAAAPLKRGDEVLPWLDQPEENPVPEVVRKPACLGGSRCLDHPQR